MSNFNGIDIAILVIFFLSILAGLMRGFVKEFISLITWIAAFVVSIMFAPNLAEKFTSNESMQSLVTSAANNTGMNPVSSVSYATVGISFLCIFISILIVGKLLSYLVTSVVDSGGISFFNRLLGGIFGVIRGFFIVLLIIFAMQFAPISSQPFWQESQLIPSFQPAVNWINKYIAPNTQTIKAKAKSAFSDVNTKIIQGISNIYGTDAK